ncbi:hypothetical protein F511_26031 [Dorcoceras hygrometricum]|uniref:Rubredoxin-like domain-containing protein n=1 Tax=Dorcoceras hygrometricum TaxID=472368 RepID=A0A2Z7AW09_9LAMI|nr:hypothetical protein F511_26031 [Dorcoceras hygrometricum]
MSAQFHLYTLKISSPQIALRIRSRSKKKAQSKSSKAAPVSGRCIARFLETDSYAESEGADAPNLPAVVLEYVVTEAKLKDKGFPLSSTEAKLKDKGFHLSSVDMREFWLITDILPKVVEESRKKVGFVGTNDSHATLLSLHIQLHPNEPLPMALAPNTGLHASKPIAPPLLSPGLRSHADRFALKSSFFLPSLHLLLPPKPLATAPKYSMRVASKQAYICRDCGYIYNDKTPFEKLPDKYFCPVCGAPKRRFKSYEPAVTKNANKADVRKARKAQIKRDEAVGQALPFAIALGAAALAGLYFYLNSTF